VSHIRYPDPPRGDAVDDHHGTPVADPFRPLEDSDAPEVRAWIDAENELTQRVLAEVPNRAEIRSAVARLWDHQRAGAPWRRADRWFQLRNSGLQDQDVLWRASAPGEEGTVLLDPNPLSVDGTVALAATAVSDDGALLAYALSAAGSDWHTWHVRRVADGEDLPDTVEWCKFASAAWLPDASGFVYGRFPEPAPGAAYEAPNRDMELRFHALGTPQADDRLVYARPDEPELGFEPSVTDDGRYLAITIWRGTDPENRLAYAALDAATPASLRVVPLIDEADARYELVGNDGAKWYLLTDRDAPRRRIVAVDLGAPQPEQWREIVPETDDTLEQARLIGGRLACVYLHDAHHRLVLVDPADGARLEVELPSIGTIVELTGRQADEELFLTLATFGAPGSVLGVRVADGRVRTVGARTLPWEPDLYVTEQAFVTSTGGARIPIFLSHRADVAPNGAVPTILYGYGGFGVSVTPTFRVEWLAWMERGGLLAVAVLRGGGEYGQSWHDDGRLANKQHVFDDFAASAAWLASSGWTRAERIGIEGRSNGGLLVGAAITQRPELFDAAVAEVGVMDMLRFERFTIGWAWTSDYGSVADADQFRTLLGYSPLHNLRQGAAYPATLITTGDHDDRVVPGHSFKFAAALQEAQAGAAPVLVRIDTDAGHGVGKPVSKLIDERADVLAFLTSHLDGGGSRSSG
jgi:prolyl oligopeptidase